MSDEGCSLSEISNESTTVPAVEDCVDHVNFNILVLDSNNAERPLSNSTVDAVSCNRSLRVILSTFSLQFLLILFAFAYLVLAENSSYKLES